MIETANLFAVIELVPFFDMIVVSLNNQKFEISIHYVGIFKA